MEKSMSSTKASSNTAAPTQLLQVNGHSYAYRRFGSASGLPLLCLQHFTGTLDNWDPAVIDPLASGREVILFDNAGVGRSTGDVPGTIAGMAGHAMAFLDELGIQTCDVVRYSLGGMVTAGARSRRAERPREGQNHASTTSNYRVEFAANVFRCDFWSSDCA